MFSRSDSSSSMKDFEIPAKEPPLELLENWRKATLVLNATRRFRYTANVKRRRDAEAQKRRLRTTGQVFRAAFRFIDAAELAPPSAEEELKAKQCGFDICGQSLRSVSDSNGPKFLKVNGGVEGIADKLKVSLESGIKGDEPDIINRKTVFGSNTYTEKPAKGFFVFVWEAMQDLTLAILGVCALVSLVIGIATEGLKEGWFDGAGIIFSILLVVFVTAASDYQQSLQFRALDKEKKKLFVQVTRNGKRQKLSVFDLVVGDIVHLSIGDQVPADGLYINGYSLVIDESSMSGESEPKRVDEKYPFLLSGTKVQDGTAMMLVTGVGMNTEWGQLMAVLGEGGNDETPLQVKLNGVATLIGQIGVVFAVVTFIVLMIRFVLEKDDLKDFSGEDVKRIVDFFAIAVTIVVVAVPEGLPLAVTLTLAYAMNKMMDDKALVRHLAACETMGSATCICSDKTGTLTTNQMTVVKAWLGGSLQEDVGKKSSLPDCLLDLLLEGIFQNTSGDVAEGSDGKVDLLGTPTETAVLGYGLTLGGNFKNVRSKSKIIKCEPFNSSKKRMAVVVKHIDGTVRAHWKGASEIVLGMCSKYIDCNGQAVELDYEKREELHEVITSFADEALRTLCLIIKDLENEPSKEGPISQDGFTCLAVVGIKDPVRPGVKEAVKLCQSAGIKVRMVTGDNVNTAKAIARECGILTDGEVIEGPAFRQLNEEEMRELIPNLQVMARSHPTDKHILVKQLRTMQEVVAVTGDGTNDAPALHESDVGLAMGIAGTEVAKESADIIILDDKFQTIVTVAKWGRSVYTNIQKFVQFQLTVNLVALVLNFTSACLTGKAPLTAVQLLWVNLIMDTLGALALATEPPYDELMQKPPVGWKGNLISSVMWRNIIVQAVYQLIVLSILQYKGKDVFCGDDEDDDLVLNTLIFNSFVFCQIFNEINAREMEKLNVFRHTLNNWVFITVLVVTVTFQIFLVEFLGKLANTTPLNLQQWLISIIIGAFSLPIAVLAKLLPIPFSKSYRSNSSLSLESKKQI